MSDKNLPVKPAAEPVDPAIDEYLRGDEKIIEAINASLPADKQLPRIPKDYVLKKTDREAVSAASHAVFAMLGGVPGYLAWAMNNKTEFYGKIYPKLLPSETQTPVGNFNFQFVTPIPETPQDRMTIADGGEVIDAEIEEDIPE